MIRTTGLMRFAGWPAARFEIPPDWTKEVPKPVQGGDDEFTCPKT